MFCANCGKPVPDGSLFCPECGAKQEVAPAPAAPAPGAVPAPDFPQPKKSNKKTIIAVCAAAVVVALVILLVCLLSGGGREAPLKNYAKFMESGSISAAQKMCPEEYWSDEFDDMDEMEEELKDSFEYLEDYYGGHLSVSYEIKEEMELSSRKISDLAAYLEDEYGMNSDKVTEGYLMKVKFTISGDEDDDSITDWIVVYRYDGDWYMDPEAAYYVDSIYDMY